MENEDYLNKYLSVGEIDDDDEYEAFEPESLFDPEGGEQSKDDEGEGSKEQSSQETKSDVLSELLKEKGILDPTQLKFENEDGEEERISFYDLSLEEQLEIIKDNADNSNDLDDDEVSFINYLRQNSLTPDELLNHVKQQAIQDYINNQQPLESVENMSDDEIFLTDLFIRIKDITDEEAQRALEHEKQNDSIYKKKVDSLRADLLEKEKLRKEEESAYAEEEKKEKFESFKQSLYDTAPTVKEIAGRIELDDEDLKETVDFLLSEDATGTRYITKALNDPEALIKMAWFYIKGEEAINYMANYYETQIKDYSKNNYEKGYEDGKNGIAPKRRVAVKAEDQKKDIPQFMNIPQNPALSN